MLSSRARSCCRLSTSNRTEPDNTKKKQNSDQCDWLRGFQLRAGDQHLGRVYLQGRARAADRRVGNTSA